MNATAAVFDVDYTLLRRSSAVAFARIAIHHGVISPRVLFSAALTHFTVLNGIGDLSGIPRDLNFLNGLSRSLLDELADETFLRYLIKSIYPDAITLIRKHQSRGCKVILATASLDFIIRPLARFLNIDDEYVVTTELQYIDGKCSGKVLGRPCFGLEKLHKSGELLRDHNIALAETAFYSDSILDQPMMDRVGYPVATNPDLRLRRHARKRNWEILRLR